MLTLSYLFRLGHDLKTLAHPPATNKVPLEDRLGAPPVVHRQVRLAARPVDFLEDLVSAPTCACLLRLSTEAGARLAPTVL